MDDNNNSPEFEFSEYKTQVSEDAEVGNVVFQVQASDGDVGGNGLIWYSIQSIQPRAPYSSSSSSPPPLSSSSPFKIDPRSGIITLSNRIDREQTGGFDVILRAEDRGFESRMGTSRLFVKVLDSNDNQPSFQRTIYDFKLRDPTSIGSFICGVTALDGDLGTNGMITYSISSSSSSSAQITDLYEIDINTGVVTNKRSLSSSSLSPSHLEFVVLARDKGNPPLTSETKVSLSFYPSTTSNFPVFSITFPRTITVNGNVATAGSILAVVSATSVKPVPPSYLISGGNVGGVFAINWKDGRLILRRESKEGDGVSTTIWVEAKDMDGLSSYLPIIINITTSKPHKPPTFVQQGYHLSVPQTSPIGTTLTTISVVPDEVPIDNILYDIASINAGDDGSIFMIESTTGVISLVGRLDGKLKERFRFWVVAYDVKRPSASLSVEIVVDVTTPRDVRPTFSEIFSGSILENSPVGAYILTVSTSNFDATPQHRGSADGSCGSPDGVNITPSTRYYFIDDSSIFNIDEMTGVVTVAGQIDYEMRKEHVLRVSARRDGYNVETLITIDVVDDNDLPPTCRDLNFQIEIPLRVKKTSQLVGNLSATIVADDVTKMSANCYRSRRPSPFIKIDKSLLYLNTKFKIPFVMNSLKFIIDVVSCDLKSTKMLSQCPVSLKIFDENIFAPVFDDTEYVVSVPKNADAGYVIVVGRARDDDMKDAYTTYFILEDLGNIFVAINSTGHLTLKKRLSVNLTLTILARDSGMTPKSSRAKVFLFPVEASDYNPIFDQYRYEFIVDDQDSIGSIISKLIISDSNRYGPNCFVHHLEPHFVSEEFSINEILNVFTIIRISGEIQINRPLNNSGVTLGSTVYKYTAKGYHRFVPFKESRAEVYFVVVGSPSDGVGCFGRPPSPTIPWDASGGRKISSLGTSDGLVRAKQFANFKLISSNESKYFELSDNGYTLILKTRPPDDIINTSFNVTIQITSTYKPHLNSYCRIQITFTEPDDLQISFEIPQYVFHVNDSFTSNSHVGTVKAEVTSNYDLTTYTMKNHLIYNILPGVESIQSMFTIDSLSGEIFMKDIVSFASSGSMTFMISSIYIKNIDRGVLVDTCKVKVQMRSSKVRLIFIPSDFYSMSINESTLVGTPIIKLKVRISGIDDDDDDDDDVERYQHLLRYSILNITRYVPFEVDSNTGWLKVKSDLAIDRSTISVSTIVVYNFTVLVEYTRDSGTPTPSSATVVVIVMRQYANRSHFECLKDRPCLNKGTCQRDPNPDPQATTISYSCRCPFNLRGSDCSVVGMGFEALKSQVFYERIPFVINKTLSIGIELSTLRSDSLLLYYSAGNSSYLTLELVGGRPMLRVGGLSRGELVVAVVEEAIGVADGSWWSIQIEMTANKIIMRSSICPAGKQACDGCSDVSNCSSLVFIDPNITFETTNQKLHVGGVEDINILLTNPVRASTHTFEGCLRYLTLGNLDVFQRAVPSYPSPSALKSCGTNFATAFGMERKSQCNSNPCLNSGVCKETIDSVGYKCYCNPNYSGRNCSDETQTIRLQPASSLKYFQSEEYKRDELLRQSSEGLNGRRRNKRSSLSSSSSSSSLIRSISMNFKTSETYGLISSTNFESKTHKHFLYILKGHVIYDVTDSSSSLFLISNELVEVSDNDWHKTVLQIYEDKVKLTVDGHTVEQSSPSSSLSFKLVDPLNLDIISFTLGSPEDTTVHGENLPGFSGCLTNFTIDEVLQPTWGSNLRFHVVYATNGSDHDGQSPPPCIDATLVSPSTGWRKPVIATASVIGILLTLFVIVATLMLRRRKRSLTSMKEDGIEMNSNHVDRHLPNNVTGKVLNSNRPDIVVTGRRRMRRSSWSDDDNIVDSTVASVSKTSTPMTTLSETVDSKTPPISITTIQNNPRILNDPNNAIPSKYKFSIMTALPKSARSIETRSVANTAFDRRILDNDSEVDDKKTISPSHSSVHRLGLDKPGFRIAQGTKIGPVWATQNMNKPPMTTTNRQHLHQQIDPAPRSRSTDPRHVISPTVGLTIEEIRRYSNRLTSFDSFTRRTPATMSNRFRDFEPAPLHQMERNVYFNIGKKNYGRRIDDSDDDDDFDDKTDAFTCSEFDFGPHLKMDVEELEIKPPLPRLFLSNRILTVDPPRRNLNLRSQSTSNDMFHQKISDMEHRNNRSASTVEMISRPRRQLPTPTASGLIGPDLLDWNLDMSWNSWLPNVAPVFREISLLPSTDLSNHGSSSLSLRNHISSSSCLSIEHDSKRRNMSRPRLGRRDSNPDYNTRGMPLCSSLHRPCNNNVSVDFDCCQVTRGRKSGTMSYKLNEIEEERV